MRRRAASITSTPFIVIRPMTTERRLRSGSARVITLALLILVIGATSLSAHRRDELLQAARIGIAAGRIELELSLTPGIAIADDVIGAIDRDHDGVLSPEEQRNYTKEVLPRQSSRLMAAPSKSKQVRQLIRCPVSCAMGIARSSFDRPSRFLICRPAATKSFSPKATAAISPLTGRPR